MKYCSIKFLFLLFTLTFSSISKDKFFICQSFSYSIANVNPVNADTIEEVVGEKVDVSEHEINKTRFAIVCGTLISSMVAIHIYQENGWWKNNRTKFHFQEDLVYGLSVDKIGHFYGASLLSYVITKSLEWSGFKTNNAYWLGAGGSFIFQTFVEMQDGFSRWGFDRVDFAMNTLGSIFPLAQYSIPFLQNIDIKMSYHPSPLLHRPGGVNFVGQKHLMMDDYEGQTFWLSYKVNNSLPSSVEQYWPDFLCLAVGYGVRDVDAKEKEQHSVLFLALDYDITKIIPSDTWFLESIGKILNYIHFPSPAVRISPSTIWYGLYF